MARAGTMSCKQRNPRLTVADLALACGHALLMNIQTHSQLVTGRPSTTTAGTAPWRGAVTRPPRPLVRRNQNVLSAYASCAKPGIGLSSLQRAALQQTPCGKQGIVAHASPGKPRRPHPVGAAGPGP